MLRNRFLIAIMVLALAVSASLSAQAAMETGEVAYRNLSAHESDYSDDFIELRGQWHFSVYRKYGKMFQYFNYGGCPVTWEDNELALVPDEQRFSEWEVVEGPAADYSTGGLLKMYRSGTADVRDSKSDSDLFPMWSEAWWCKAIDVPAGFLKEDTVTLILGVIDDLDVVYINGRPVASSGFMAADGSKADPSSVPDVGGFLPDGEFKFEKSYWEVPRVYELPSSLFHEGRNEICIRIYNNNSFGGFYDRSMALCATDIAARGLQGMPTVKLEDASGFKRTLDSQIAAIESENLIAYGGTLAPDFHENEKDKLAQVKHYDSLFTSFSSIKIDDRNGGFYISKDGRPCYVAERTIKGVAADGSEAVIFSDSRFIQYFDESSGLEKGNHSRTYSVTYTSALDAMGGKRLVYSVYLPESYYADSSKRYPVVYLLHGINSTGQSFINVDKINEKMDEWIAAGEIPEMIVVMPDSGKSSWYKDTEGKVSDSAGPWESHIHVDIVGQVEAGYRVLEGAGFRGLTGISMGGGGAYYIGLRHTDKFSSFASHMGAVGDETVELVNGLPQELIPGLDFYLDCGYDDQMVNPDNTVKVAKALEARGANVTWELRDGAHNSAFYMSGMLKSMKMHAAHFAENGYDE